MNHLLKIVLNEENKDPSNMILNPTQFALLVLLLASFSTTSAKTHVVTVEDNFFSPVTVVIEAGDTVRWVNQGSAAHNVYAQGKFRCANGCDADGGNGDFTSDAWVSEVTFRIPETIPYVCQPHEKSGMVGTVVVQIPNTGTTHQVEAQVDNTFIPDDITILAGDVVYFSNQGGEHNINSLDDSLICADGCEGDGMTVSTNPTGFPWEFYLRFNVAGDIPYHCANPAHNNQSGILRVLSDVFFRHGFESQ